MIVVSSGLEHSSQDVGGDALGARVRSPGGGVDGGAPVTGRLRQPVGPPATRGVEDKISPRPGIEGGGVDAAVQLAGRVLGGTGGHHLKSWNGRRVSVPIPAR